MEAYVQQIHDSALASGEIATAASIFPLIPGEVKPELFPILVFHGRKSPLVPVDNLRTNYHAAPSIVASFVARKKDLVADDSSDNPFTELERIFKAVALQLIQDDPEFYPKDVDYFESFQTGTVVLVCRVTFVRPVSSYALAP